MPNIKSAKKRVIIARKKNLENRALRSRMNTAVKNFNNAIDTNNIEEAERLLPLTMSVIDQTVSKGVIHKNNAANKKSALSKRLSDVKSGKIEIKIKKDNKTIAAEKARAAQAAREAVRAENAKKAAERKAAKLEAEQAKLEAEGKAKKAKKDAEKKPAKAEKTEEKKPAAKKTTKSEEKTEEKKPAAKKKTAKPEEKKDAE
ncbi:MAG: 30S ribosomal protein S20 [Clostridia bacterium]|nr:30S ribosomal protein S20 [Clostridia bacterium]